MFVKEMRKNAALEGILPEYINKMIDKFENCGNIYGVHSLAKKLVEKIKMYEKKTDTLLFLGADARYIMCQNAIQVIDTMAKVGKEFTVLENESDSGFAYETLMSVTAETKAVMEKCAKMLNEYKTIVVYDPNDAKVLLREYKEYGINLTAKIVTFTAYLSENISALNLKKTNEKYTYQDPAMLTRELGEENEPRNIISNCGTLVDMMLCKKETMFAGNLLMGEYMPDTMKLIAQNRWKNAIATGADTLVCASVSEYAVLKSVKPENMNICTIEQLVLK